MTSQYRLFVSHGGEDTYIVESTLKPKLLKTGATVFVDAGELEYGDDFRSIIIDELNSLDELLVLLTPSSIIRPWVLAEIGATVVRKKRIVALRYGVSDNKLQEHGILTILGTQLTLPIQQFENYIAQLAKRVEGAIK